MRVRGTTRELPQILDEAEPDEVIIAIPSAPGRAAHATSSRACRERGIPRAHAADGVRAARAARSTSRARCATCRSRTCSGASRSAWSSTASGATCEGAGRDGHRRRRLDRLRAVPPDLARRRRAGSCSSTTPRTTCSRSSASCEEDRHVHPSVLAPVLADCKEEERMREVLARGAPADHLPRRRLQARRADGAQPGRGDPQQRDRDARRRDGRRPARPRARSC